ncbi:MAG: hypothetical protein KDA93_16180 [Planctomycetaceae bacterium]|nr:hypothetical protein [Planctomycetaceae bacterium]
MLHTRRVWCVNLAVSAEELARQLIETTWCLCTGFELEGRLFLNDSTSENALNEFAIVKRHEDGRSFLQVESITVSWCDLPQMLHYVQATLMGEYDISDFVHEVSPRLQTPEEHGRCPLCA